MQIRKYEVIIKADDRLNIDLILKTISQQLRILGLGKQLTMDFSEIEDGFLRP